MEGKTYIYNGLAFVAVPVLLALSWIWAFLVRGSAISVNVATFSFWISQLALLLATILLVFGVKNKSVSATRFLWIFIAIGFLMNGVMFQIAANL